MATVQVTRQRFLRVLGRTGTALVGLSIVAGPRTLLALAANKGTLRKVANLSALKSGVNGPFAFAVDTTAALNTNKLYLVKTSASKVTALEGTCRHHGCLINWVAADSKFECPCHGSQYAVTGKVVHGPATANLFQHTVTIRAGQVWVLSVRATT